MLAVAQKPQAQTPTHVEATAPGMQPPVNPDRLQDRIEQARAMVVGAIIGVPAINALATVGGCAALSHGSVASLAALVAGALALTGVCVMVGVQGYRDLRDGVTSSR